MSSEQLLAVCVEPGRGPCPPTRLAQNVRAKPLPLPARPATAQCRATIAGGAPAHLWHPDNRKRLATVKLPSCLCGYGSEATAARWAGPPSLICLGLRAPLVINFAAHLALSFLTFSSRDIFKYPAISKRAWVESSRFKVRVRGLADAGRHPPWFFLVAGSGLAGGCLRLAFFVLVF